MKNNKVCVICLGSPYGLDQVAWVVSDRLDEYFDSPGVSLLKLRDPAQLADTFEGLSHAFVLDAVKDTFGVVRGLSLDELVEGKTHSSHALQLPDLIQLGQQLNPDLRCDVIGIGIDDDQQSLGHLVELALPKLKSLLDERLPRV